MNRQKVNSTMFTSVGYDEKSQTLELEFSSGKIYQHSNVPIRVYTEFMNAPSLGKYYNQWIKGKYASFIIN